MNIEAVIFDCGRTLYMPETISLFPGTRRTLEDLTDMRIKIGLLSVAVTEDVRPRLEEIKNSGLEGFFQAIDIVPRSTKGKDFSKILKELEMEGKIEHVLIVGDNLKREIENGNRIGAYTVLTTEGWVMNWEPQNELQVPKARIESINGLIPLIERLG